MIVAEAAKQLVMCGQARDTGRLECEAVALFASVLQESRALVQLVVEATGRGRFLLAGIDRELAIINCDRQAGCELFVS